MVIKDIVTLLDNLYPKELAWDNDLPRIGFVLGDKNQELNGILLCLDINLDVISEAITKNLNLIIAHHPLIFHPIYKIDYETSQGKVIKKLIENNLNIYVMHTNLDVGISGVGDTLAETLGLKNIVGENLKDAYLRIGEIEEVKFKDIIDEVCVKLKLSGLKYAGNLEKKIKKVGILGGSGGSEADVMQALNYGLDLYISSEFRLSAVQLAYNNDLCIIEVNHGVEKLVFPKLKNKLLEFVNTNICISEVETDPFMYYKK